MRAMITQLGMHDIAILLENVPSKHVETGATWPWLNFWQHEPTDREGFPQPASGMRFSSGSVSAIRRAKSFPASSAENSAPL